MKKIGCSNISILFTAFGIVPLFISIFVIYKELSLGKEIAELIILLPVILFGLLACGYRSCLFINNEYIEIKKSILGKYISKKRFEHKNYKNILIDIESHHAISSGEASGGKFYTFTMIGSKISIKPLEFTDYVRVKALLGDKKNWGKASAIADKISRISALPVNYSDKVKRLNGIK